MDEKYRQQVVDARINKQWTYSMIFEEYGVPKSTAQGWVAKHEKGGELVDTKVTGFYQENLQRDRPSNFDRKDQSMIMDFLDQLTPLEIVSDKYANVDIELSDYAIVGSDFHFGTHDDRCIEIFLKTVEEIKPKVIVLNGDTMDMLAISRYPKDLIKNWSLLDERIAYHQFLDNLLSVCSGAEIYETVSNHSGQSIDGRWRRYLSDRLGELASLPDISERLSYQNVFMGEYQKMVKHVDHVDLNGLLVTHGTTVRKNGGYSARGEIDKWSYSILHGHTHRIGTSCQRIPALGNRPEKQIYGFEGGCMCSLEASYGLAMNWQQGFNIVSLCQKNETFGIEQVLINNGCANVSTLGMTIKA
jgi:hypothetical protein